MKNIIKMKTIRFDDFDEFMKEFRKYGLRTVHLSLAPGWHSTEVDGRPVIIPKMVVRLAARTKDGKFELYLRKYFEDEEDAEFEYHRWRRKLDAEEIIIRYGMGGKW